MKRFFSKNRSLLAFVGTMLTSVGALAQPALPNASFETWEARTIQTLSGPLTFQVPQSWNPGFLSGTFGSFGIAPRFNRSTVAHTGSASVQITPGLLPDSLGGDLLISMPTSGSTAFGTSCWVRYSRAQSRELKGGVLAFVTRNQGGVVDTIGIGGFPLPAGPANTWTQLSGPIGYLNPAVTQGDSVTMLLGYFTGVPGDAILFDDAVLLRTAPSAAPADREIAAAPLTLGPNPASVQTDAVTLTVPSTGAAPAVLVLTDALGRTMGHLRNVRLAVGQNQFCIPTTNLSAGTYTVRLIAPTGTRSVTLVRE